MHADSCSLVFGIPTSRGEYVACIDDPKGRDLIRSQALSWSTYKSEIVDLFVKHSRTWLDNGARIKTGATLASFAASFREPGVKVVILFSHKAGRSLEFFDGMADINDVITAIPSTFDGLLDLCVCSSPDLAGLVKDACPELIVKYSLHAIPYRYWFPIYGVTIEYMAMSECSYEDALMSVLKMHLKLRKKP